MSDGKPDAFGAALGALSAWLAAAGIPYAVIGGVAVSLQATARYTQDIDAVLWTADDTWDALIASATPFGIRPRIDALLEFAARTRVLLLVHDGGVPIDVSLGALPFEQDLVESAAVFAVGGFASSSPRPSSSRSSWRSSTA